MFRLTSRKYPLRRALLISMPLVLLAIGLTGWRSGYLYWQLRTAKSLLNQGNSGDVQAALDTLHAVQGTQIVDSPELLFLLGRAHRRAGDFEKGMKYLQQAEASGWDAEAVEQQRFLAQVQRGRIDFKDSSLNQLLQKNSSDDLAYEVYEALAKGYLFSYRFSDALHCLNFWTEWCPKATDARMWRASIWEQTDRWEQANDEYQKVLEIDPSHLEARLALGRNLLMQLNQAEAAYEEFRTCLKQQPGNFNAVLGMATCERQLARPEQAESRMRQLLDRELTAQQRSNVLMELGQVLLDRGELNEAIRVLTEVTQTDPLNSTAFYAIGSAWAGLGEKEKAFEFFDKSKQLREQFGRLTTITSELVSHPERADLRWEAGKILMDQGMYREGAAWMSTALMYDPDHRPAHEALARYYETVKPDQALARHHRSKAGGQDDEQLN